MKISEAALTELKLRNPCDQVAGQWVKLRKGGKLGMRGPCPLHSPDPQARDSTSFECDHATWVCATCHDGGDILRLVARRHGLDPRTDFRAVVNLLGGVAEPSPERAAELERECATRQAQRQREENEYRERERRTAFEIWHAGEPWPGSPVEQYLRGPRGIAVLPDQLRLRFAPTVAFFHGQEIDERGRKAPRIIHRGPAMLAPIVDAGGFFRGVHITWIDLDQPNGKARIIDPETGAPASSKKVRGSLGGNAIPLVDGRGPPVTVYAGEGIETVLSVWFALHQAGRDLSRAWFRSTVDLGNLGGRAAESVRHPSLKDKAGRARRVPGPVPHPDDKGFALPPGALHVVLLGDGDSDRFLTQCALRRASVRLGAAGISTAGAWAPEGMDFNDVLRQGAPPPTTYESSP